MMAATATLMTLLVSIVLFMVAGYGFAHEDKAGGSTLSTLVGIVLLAFAITGVAKISYDKAIGSPIPIADLAQSEPRHFKQIHLADCDETLQTNYVVLQELRVDSHTLELQPINHPLWVNTAWVNTVRLEWITNELVTIWRNESGTFGIRPITKMTYDAAE